jgi:hypothetical protein
MLIRISEGVNWFAIVGQKYIIRLAVKEIEGSTISWARRLLGGSQAVMDATELATAAASMTWATGWGSCKKTMMVAGDTSKDWG